LVCAVGLQHETKVSQVSLAASSVESREAKAAAAAAERAVEAAAVEAAFAKDEPLAQLAARDVHRDSLRLLQVPGDEVSPEGEGSWVPDGEESSSEDTAKAMKAKWDDEKHKGNIIQKMTTMKTTTTEPLEMRADRHWQEKLDTLLSVKTFLYQDHGVVGNLARQLAVPIAALGLGLVLWCALPKQSMVPHLVMFFGAQSFVNIYMKAILSDAIIDAELKMRGFQGPLIMTALQQLVTFVCLWTLVGLSQFTPWKYRPRPLTKTSEVLTVFCHAVFFSLNIALNNFSLSLLDLSASVMVRSLSPLSALVLQVFFAGWFDSEALGIQPGKLLLLLGGVICAAIALMAKYHDEGPARSNHYGLGLVLCFGSVAAASMELVVVVIIGKGMKMNSLDTILYMSLPAFMLITLPALYLRHPVSYPYHPPATDWEIFWEVWKMKNVTVYLVLLSGVFALWYHLMLYITVRNLSPLYATYAGNFNKVAAIGFSVFLGFESLPSAPWNVIMALAVLGNMASFTGYSLWPNSKKGGPSRAAIPPPRKALAKA
jgi:hypothetical protein